MIKPRDLLVLARQQTEHSDEAWRRSAISRAYYASFHRCLEWEEAQTAAGEAEQSPSRVHQRLIDELQKRSRTGKGKEKRQSRTLVRLMREQRERRVTADYFLDRVVGLDDVRNQIDAARKVFEACAW